MGTQPVKGNKISDRCESWKTINGEMPHVVMGFLKTIFESMFVFASPVSPDLNNVNSVKSMCFFLVNVLSSTATRVFMK